MPPVRRPFPETIDDFIDCAKQFERRLEETKSSTPHEGFQWSPGRSLTSLDLAIPAIGEHFAAFRNGVECGAMLDIGCGDGDLSYLFASLGYDITAIDFPAANFNGMAGVRALQERLHLPVRVQEINVDVSFELERESYGLVFLLGVPYHLKNPYLVLETLSTKARYCLLSTRVANHSPSGTLIRDEPLAYLLDHREADGDATAYWIFSREGLLRLAKRTGWRVIGTKTADEHMTVFLRSQLCSAPATVTLLKGWSEPVAEQWAWTDKIFSFEVTLQEMRRPDSFLLGFVVPQTIAEVSTVTVHCTVNGLPAGAEVFRGQGDKLFEKALPEGVDHTQAMLFEFTVEHRFDARPDPRDLGVIMPFTGAISGIGARILFWVD